MLLALHEAEYSRMNSRTTARLATATALAAALLTAACAPAKAPAPSGSAPDLPTQTAAPTAPPETPKGTIRAYPEGDKPPRQNVILDQPADGETVRQNPFVITGKARTFENNVQLRVRDAAGAEIRQTFTTAQGDMGHFNPFTATIYVTRDPGAKVTVEAYELSAKDGSLDSIDKATVAFAVPLRRVRLFFPRGDASASDCTKVFPLERDVPMSVSLARLLVEALIDGPTAAEQKEGYSSPFPPGSGVESVNLKGGVIRVDFNWRLQNVGGSCRAQAIRAAVDETLRNLPEVDQVVISAGGSEKLALQP